MFSFSVRVAPPGQHITLVYTLLAYYELSTFFMETPTVLLYRLGLTRSPVCRSIETSTMFEQRCKALISDIRRC